MCSNHRRVGAALLAAVLLVALVPAVGVAIDDPNLLAFAPDPILQPGERTELRVQILNDDRGDLVAEAGMVRATLESGDSPVVVRSGTTVVGTIPSGEVAEVTFDVRVPEGAAPGEYDLPIDLEHVADDEVVTRTRRVTVRIPEAPRFEVVSTSTDASVGDRGTVSLDLRNGGTAPARDATITLASEDPALTFAGGDSTETYVGRWNANETVRVDVPVDVADGATGRPFAISATVDYEDAEGQQRTRSVPVAVTPSGDPAFAVGAVDADVRVGGQGTIQASVENTGGSTARDATVRLDAQWANLTTPLQYPVGDLDPGESAEVRFTVEALAGIEPGPQRATLYVERTTTDGERRRSDPLGATVELGPRRSPIAVQPENATFEVDDAGVLDLRLTNRAGGEVTDLRATLTATDPFTSDDPAAYVRRLGPGESTVVSFHLDVSEDAVPGTRPVAVSLAYDDANGNARVVRDVPVGVTVVEPPGSEFPVAAAAVVVVALAAGAVWWYRRR